MRIVVAHDSIDTEGGVETYLLSTMRQLRARGHQIALLYFHRAKSQGTLRSAAHLTLGIEDHGTDTALAALRQWEPDVCFSHNMGPLAIDRALMAEWPVVKMLHGFFGTCISGLKMHAFPSPAACSRVFGPACLALYFPRRCGKMSGAAMMNGYRWAADQQALFSRYARIVVASRYMGDEVVRNGAPRERLDVLPLFSTLDGEAGASEGEPDTVLFGGRMTALKGGDVLVRAAARAMRMLGRRVRLLMVGDGPQKESWRELASGLGVEAEFTGWIGVGDRARVYRRAFVLAVPSLWPEPFGLIGLDAASLGKPAVAFNVGGIAEWLTDGVNGRLVDPARGEEGLAEGLAAMLSAPDARRRMSCEALNVARRMSVAAHADQLEDVLRAAVSAGHPVIA